MMTLEKQSPSIDLISLDVHSRGIYLYSNLPHSDLNSHGHDVILELGCVFSVFLSLKGPKKKTERRNPSEVEVVVGGLDILEAAALWPVE